MAFVQLSNINLSFGARDLIRNATLTLAEGSRAALAGPNGAGKSTLMKIAAGLAKADSGDFAITKGARISYLPQTSVVLGTGTVEQEAEAAFGHFAKMLERQDELGKMLQSGDIDDRTTARLLEEFDDIGRHVESGGYFRRAERVSEVLRGLGFRTADFGKRTAELSGGWQMRLALAKILLEDPDIMLLDEPTNYLDLEARSWLEGFLADYRGGVLLVSHDRYFLDTTIKEVYELFNGKLSRYPGSYTAYEGKRARELEAIFESWERQQEEIQKIEDFVRRFRYKESKAAQVQSRIKMLDKIVPIEIPEGMKKIHFTFPPAPRSGKIAVRLEAVGKSYGANKVVDKISLEIDRGRKIAFVGPNGAGKSTLMRLIAGIDKDHEGTITLGAGIETGYFAQDSAEQMSSGLTVEAEAESVCPNNLIPKIRNLLGAFLFRGDDVEKPVSVLSGGERSRLALLKMLLHPANLLILDEPTNHLDLTSKDVLLEALSKFEGTVLFVSHDRGFIEELADMVLELEAGASPRLYHGNYAYYLEKKASLDASLGNLPIAASPDAAAGAPSPRPDAAPLSWEEDKARKARIRKLERREEEITQRLDAISMSTKALENSMALPANYTDGSKARKILAALEDLKMEADALSEEWMEVADSLAGISKGG